MTAQRDIKEPTFSGTEDEIALIRAAIAHYARYAHQSRIRDLRIRCRAAMSGRAMKDLDQVVQYQCRNQDKHPEYLR